MPNNFPNDITIGILLKLPAKSLLRFKNVCKLWQSLIEDRQFIKQQNHYHKICLFCWKNNEKDCNSYAIDAPLQHDSGISRIELPLEINCYFSRRYVNFCNGLFLLAFPRHKLVLWNPATKESRTIPRPISVEEEKRFRGLCCLSYVSSLDDYRIVCVAPPRVHIFSVKSDSWKLIGEYPSNHYYTGDMVVADGIVYMVTRGMTCGKISILSLCLKDESFQTVDYPNEPDLSIDEPLLHTIGESLFMTKFSTPINNRVNFEVWYMEKDSSWSKFLAILVPRILDHRFWDKPVGYSKDINRFWIQPVGFMKDGNMLFLRDETKDFAVYDAESGMLKQVEIAGLEEESLHLTWAITYAESLISPNAL